MRLVLHFLYNLVLLLALPFYVLGSLLWSLLRPAHFRPFLSRLGMPGRHYRLAVGGVWVHAVSVGEVAASASLIHTMQETVPGLPVTLTCTTLTGYRMAQRVLGEDFPVAFAPLDLPFAVRTFYRRIRPQVVAVAELEIWPNFFRAAARRSLPLVLFNGRMPDKDLAGYRRLAFYFRWVLEAAHLIGVQSEQDAHRFRRIGAAPARVVVLGNIKFDYQPPQKSSTLAEDCGLTRGQRIVALASSHRGEEALVLDALQGVLEDVPGLTMVLVPRHPQRGEEVAALARAAGLQTVLRSKARGESPRCLVVDTIGELGALFPLCELVIMGGSFDPGVQGHNPLEPAYFGKPVVFGPEMGNFRQVRDTLLAGEGAIAVPDGPALGKVVRDLLVHPEQGQALGQRARAVLDREQGASQRYAAAILNMVGLENQ